MYEHSLHQDLSDFIIFIIQLHHAFVQHDSNNFQQVTATMTGLATVTSSAMTVGNGGSNEFRFDGLMVWWWQQWIWQQVQWMTVATTDSAMSDDK